MPANFKEVSENQRWKQELKALLDNPILQQALAVLESENCPAFEIRLPAGASMQLSVMEAIALDAAQRAGAQAVIKKLKAMPYLTSGTIDRAATLGKPWEYLGEELEKSQESNTKDNSKPKKK